MDEDQRTTRVRTRALAPARPKAEACPEPKGTHATRKGNEENPGAMVTDATQEEILRLWHNGYPYIQIAKRMGIFDWRYVVEVVEKLKAKQKEHQNKPTADK